MTRNPHICAATDCNNKLNDKMISAKYCSKQCKWREFTRKRHKIRKERGLCPQCGREMDSHANRVTYCTSCQEYYRERYILLKQL